MVSQVELEEIIRKTVSLYNRMRSPEAIAKLVHITPVIVTISFSGSFCYGCGVLDYVEDFIHEMKAFTDKVELKVAKTRQVSPRSFEADYLVKIK